MSTSEGKDDTNETTASSQTESSPKKEISYEDLSSLLQTMLKEQDKLSKGYDILSVYEKASNFYINLLKLSFSSTDALKKLSSSSFLTFITKNYDKYVNNDEKLSIVSYLLDNLSTQDYYLKNFLAKVLGFIAAKEFPNCYESFIKILLNKLNSNNASNMNENEIDTILRILICVLKECDDSCAIITCDVLPVIINIFKLSKYNQKNREKCLIIISLLLNKLSYADGNDMDLLSLFAYKSNDSRLVSGSSWNSLGSQIINSKYTIDLADRYDYDGAHINPSIIPTPTSDFHSKIFTSGDTAAFDYYGSTSEGGVRFIISSIQLTDDSDKDLPYVLIRDDYGVHLIGIDGLMDNNQQDGFLLKPKSDDNDNTEPMSQGRENLLFKAQAMYDTLGLKSGGTELNNKLKSYFGDNLDDIVISMAQQTLALH